MAHELDGPLIERLYRTLPFDPTDAQRRATAEIDAAMARPRPMNVLLQGDVGSGKTLVAVHAALVAIGSGHQAAIMAPTEVLAGQHFQQVAALLGSGAIPYLELASSGKGDSAQGSLLEAEPPAEDGPRVAYALLSAAVTGKDRARIVDGIAAGDVDLVVGTHALVQEGGVRRPVPGRDRRATSVRRASADGAQGQGSLPGRADHDGHPDPANARAHLLRRPRRRGP